MSVFFWGLLELEFYVETNRAEAWLHKVVESLIERACRTGRFRVEWSFAVNHEQIVGSDAKRHTTVHEKN